MKIDLTGVTNKVELFQKLDGQTIVQHWGYNWDALNDCLRDLDSGGFTEKYEFPLKMEITNWKEFSINSPADFTIFKEVLESQVVEHNNYGKELTVIFL